MQDQPSSSGTVKTCNNCGFKFKSDEDYLNHSNKWRQCTSGHLWFNCRCDSTLILRKGKYPWYKPELSMNVKGRSIFAKLNGKDSIPHLPTQILQIQQALSNPELTNTDLADKVIQEPMLASEVFNMANNKISSRAPKIDSMHHAIAFIGRKPISDMAFTAGLRAFRLKTKVFTKKVFWEESFQAASIASFLHKKFDFDLPRDHLYVATVLANIGKIIGSICMPDKTDQAYSRTKANKNSISWHQAEQELEIPPHTALADIGGALWGLPGFVIEAATKHHQIDPRTNSVQLFEAVGLAIQLRHRWQKEPLRVDQSVLEGALRKINFQEGQLDQLFEEFSQTLSLKP